MARKRLGLVHESERELEMVAARLSGTGYEARIRMLQRIQTNPDVRTSSLTNELDYNERTIRRWWKLYQAGGLDYLMSDVPERIRSRTGSHALARRGESTLIAPNVVSFLNGLSRSDNPDIWLREVKLALESLLKISRVTFRLNLMLDLSSLGNIREKKRGRPLKRNVVNIAQRRDQLGGKESVSAIMVTREHLDQLRLDIEQSRSLDVSLYHEPIGRTYKSPSGEVIGSVLFWQEKSLPPVPDTTVGLIDSLESFITFLFTDCIARRPRNVFDVRTFTSIVMRIAEEKGLTPRQREVLIPHMLGQSRAVIAKRLGISPDTVKGHITAIYQKSNCKSPAELMAQYLTPVDHSPDPDAG